MLRFNTAFLLKATAVTALASLPMAFDKEQGAIISACAIPLGISLVGATQIDQQGEYELKFKNLPDSTLEIYTRGGWQHQQLTQGQVVGIGVAFACIFGLTAYYLQWGGLPDHWPLFVTIGCVAFLGGVVCSTRQLVDPGKRRFIKRLLVFGKPSWLCWWWQVQDGDHLAVFLGEIKDSDGDRHGYQHDIYVCRGRRRYRIANCKFKYDRVIEGVETSAERIAKLIDIPYEGYRKSKGFWWW